MDISGISGGGRIGRDIITLAELSYYEELQVERIPYYCKRTLFNSKHEKYNIEEVEDEKAGYVCRFVVSEVRQQPDDFEDLLNELNDDKFIFNKQYHAKVYEGTCGETKTEDDSLLDLL